MVVIPYKREQGLVYHEKGALSDFTSFAAHSNDSGGAGRNSVDNCNGVAVQLFEPIANSERGV